MSRVATGRLLLCRSGSRVLSSLLLLTLFLTTAYPAATAESQADGQPQQHVFHLKYVEAGFSRSISVDLDEREVVFKAEPDFGDQDIVRSAIPAGPGEKDFIGLAWDMSKRKLYIDKNRNLDLTDDTPVSPTDRDRSPFFSFKGINIESTVGQVRLPYVIDMDMYRLSRMASWCTVVIRSGWEGEIEMYGKKWYLGIADNLDGVLRRNENDRFILLEQEVAERRRVQPRVYDEMSVPDNLFLDGHSYDLSFAFEPGDENPELVVTFTERHPTLGTLEIEGRSIARMTLERSELGKTRAETVVLDSPGKSVRIPVGEYAPVKVYMDGGSNALVFTADVGRVFVRENKPDRLKVGGPLNHTVDVRRLGTALSLNYRLRGVGGELYTQAVRDLNNRPTFAIYKDDQKVASGSFEYG